MDDHCKPSPNRQQVVDAFVAAWALGVRVDISPFLAAVVPEEREALFRDMLLAAIACRQAAGEQPKAEDYLASFPQFCGVIEQLLPGNAAPTGPDAGNAADPLRTAAWQPTERSAMHGDLPDVPGYQLMRLLGEGGMGVVYEAVHRASGRHVALKMVVPAQPEDEASMKLFLREATTLSQLDHKRIIKFYEVGIAAGRLYLVMEYVDAINLKQLLSQRNEPRRVRLFCAFICQVLDALSYAHRLGFVHRDVKPGNVLVMRHERKYCTKLADFGLAKSFECAGFSSVTSAGECRGTMAFMAPEQLTDPRSVRPSADIFSTAATLYYFLSGHYPCDYSTSPSVVMAVLQADVIPLDRWRCDLPRPLVALVHRGLAKRPEDRFPSAQAMRRELIAFAKGQST